MMPAPGRGRHPSGTGLWGGALSRRPPGCRTSAASAGTDTCQCCPGPHQLWTASVPGVPASSAAATPDTWALGTLGFRGACPVLDTFHPGPPGCELPEDEGLSSGTRASQWNRA
ncbi:hypothetical protein GHT09_001589 [Marmota monax]|uniref:Uncharacterized protein n=1 Tax=Marmota monax TaxID=9995 RepID=A0A834UR19_MARMO|nr:hypothetical protein GHT09_001589 [Marmota monax]